MSQKSISSLVEYKATAREKAFGVLYSDETSAMFFANVEDNDTSWSLSSGTNVGCIYADNTIYHNLYDSRAILFHDLAARRHKYPYLDTYDYQHIYKCITDSSGARLNNSIKSIVQSQGTFYAIDGLQTYGHYYVNDEIYSWLTRDNGYAFPVPTDIKTLLYNPKIEKRELSCPILSVLHDVQYNTLYEVPGNIWQDYQSGAMLATTVKCKNQYDGTFSMQKGDTTLLSHAREYSEVCNCNDQIYLKFTDKKAYQKSTISAVDVDLGDGYVVTHQKVIPASDIEQSEFKMPQIEMLKNINRGASLSNHKSSLYSLSLKTQFLTTANLSDKIKENLRLEIKNCIRKVAEKIAPANTQLFSVTVS